MSAKINDQRAATQTSMSFEKSALLLERTHSDAITLTGTLKIGDLGLRTVCQDWDVRALVNHFLASGRTISRAAADLPTEGTLGDDSLADNDPAQLANEMLAKAADLWRQPTTWEGTCDFGAGVMPKENAAIIAMYDLAVHCWDLRVALGQKAPIDTEVATAALAFVTAMVDDDVRAAVGYDPSIEIDSGASASDRLLAFLGRQP